MPGNSRHARIHYPPEASSSFCSARTSEQGPLYPTLRANPFPEVTDLFCRLPLPTLFYQLEAVHLGDLLRIWVRSGAKITLSPHDFQGPTTVHRTPREARCFTELRPYRRASRFHGVRSLQRKENSSQDCGQRLVVRLSYLTGSRRTDPGVRVQEY